MEFDRQDRVATEEFDCVTHLLERMIPMQNLVTITFI